MKVGKIVWLSSHPNPFVVSPAHCLEPECACTDVWLQLAEIDLEGRALPQPLSFEVRVCLRHWIERERPSRPPRIEALVRELLAEFPTEWIQELIDIRRERQAAEKRLAEHRFTSPRGELVCYSDVAYAEGGLAKGGGKYGFFFSHAGRDYLIEDHYCPTPDCDCRRVHVEFWQRTESEQPRRIDVRQRLMAAFTLDGELEEVRFTEEDERTTAELLRAWSVHAAGLRDEFEQRYRQIKVIGGRSFPPPTEPAPVARREAVRRPAASRRKAAVGRNAPCPCGSGRKFKHCCARQRK